MEHNETRATTAQVNYLEKTRSLKLYAQLIIWPRTSRIKVFLVSAALCYAVRFVLAPEGFFDKLQFDRTFVSVLERMQN